MGKEFKNIDELFKDTVGMGSAKAPSSVRSSVMSKTSGGKFWMIGASMLLLTAIGAVIVAINMPQKDSIAVYKTIDNPRILRIDKYISDLDELNLANSFASEKDGNTSASAKDVAEKSLVIAQTTPIAPTAQTDINSPSSVVRESVMKKATAKTDIKQIAHKQNQPQTAVASKPSVNLATASEAAESPSTKAILSDKPSTSIGSDQTSLETESAEKPTLVDQAEKNQDETASANHDNKPPHTEKAISSGEVSLASDSAEFFQKATDSSFVIADLTPAEEDSTATEVKIEVEAGTEKGNWMIGAKIGPSINNVNYGGSEFSSSLNKFHSEKLGYQGHIYGQYISPSKFVATLGLGLERQSFNTTFLTTVDTFYTIESDTFETVTLKNHYGITQNQYLQIPARLGYQVVKNKWIFEADLSLQMNYLLKTSGSYLKDNSVIDLEGSDVFKRMVFTYSAGANLKYNVVNNLYLNAEARYVPALQNYYESSYAKRSLNAVQLGFGIGIKL